MATANELFAANGEDYIVIDSDLRTMTFPASVNNIGVENDKDVHKLNFKMPRYFSGYDLSEFIIHINYVNANGDADMYYVLDPTINENEIIFSWLVGRHACLYRGSVTFIVCLKLADGEGDVAQEYNTTLASLQVLPGLETEPTILETEHDIIEQLLLSINDTNAKIKAVLDTGLTPEQIAEFYNKSKNYDTKITANTNEITALKSRIIYDNMSLSSSGSVLGYLNKLPNGVRAYVHTWQTTSDMPSGLTDTAYVFQFVTDAVNRIYDYVILTRINDGEQWLGKVSDADLSTRTLSWIKFPSRAEMDALNSGLNNNGAWYELLGGKSQNGDYTLNDSYARYKSVVVMLFGLGSTIASCIYPTTMLITAGYHPVVEVGSNKVDIVFTSSTNVKVSDLNGSVRIYGIR